MTERQSPADRRGRLRPLRQPPAARAHRRPLRDGEPRARARNGLRPQGDRRRARDRPRLQVVLRQGEPHIRPSARAASASTRRCRSSPRSRRRSACRSSPTCTRTSNARPSARSWTSCRSRPSCAARPISSSRRPGPAGSSTSRRASSWRPGTWRTWPRRSRGPAIPNVMLTERGASLRLQHPGVGHARPADHGGDDRRAGDLRRHPFGPAAGRAGRRRRAASANSSRFSPAPRSRSGWRASSSRPTRTPTGRPPTGPTWCRCANMEALLARLKAFDALAKA